MTMVVTANPPDFADAANLRERLVSYLERETGKGWTIGPLKRYAVGFSWITYGFDARSTDDQAGQGMILRLGPPYGLFAPYSALPQFAVLKALEGTQVPVPKAYWWSDDTDILGAPFFISERVTGAAPVPWVGAHDAGFEEGYRRGLGEQFVSALACLHTCPWQDKAGFEVEGLTRENAAIRQVEFWEEARTRWALKPFPMLHWALRWLREHLPVAPRLSIVHGDYRLGNFLEQDARITAILDWELVHLGDPHEDLGWAFLPQYSGGTGLVCRLLAKEDFVAQYERQARFTVQPETLHFYVVLALVKLALTHMAAVRCFEDGRFNDMRMPAMGTQIAPVLRQISKLVS
jgi:aminoglycoside phosphotransferase (APT) family kinase protein